MTSLENDSKYWRGLAVAIALLPGTALGAEHTIRWVHPTPGSVAGFVIHVGTESRSYSETILVGDLSPNKNGIYKWPIDVPRSGRVFVAVSAVGKSGLWSALSNERQFGDGAPAELAAPGAPFVIGP
ncbi:MAG: hypothetical protein ACQGVK_18490 [Myxococcota bacterium]